MGERAVAVGAVAQDHAAATPSGRRRSPSRRPCGSAACARASAVPFRRWRRAGRAASSPESGRTLRPPPEPGSRRSCSGVACAATASKRRLRSNCVRPNHRGEQGPAGQGEQRGNSRMSQGGPRGGGPRPRDVIHQVRSNRRVNCGRSAGGEQKARHHPQHEDQEDQQFANLAFGEQALQQAARAAGQQQVERDVDQHRAGPTAIRALADCGRGRRRSHEHHQHFDAGGQAQAALPPGTAWRAAPDRPSACACRATSPCWPRESA